jgi:hypothetical protein
MKEFSYRSYRVATEQVLNQGCIFSEWEMASSSRFGGQHAIVACVAASSGVSSFSQTIHLRIPDSTLNTLPPWSLRLGFAELMFLFIDTCFRCSRIRSTSDFNLII